MALMLRTKLLLGKIHQHSAVVPVLVAALSMALLSSKPALCQTTVRGARTVPTDAYFNHLGLLYAGTFVDAQEAFQADLRSGIKTVDTRWIDAICYYAMLGECHYHLGEYALALDEYAAALQLYLRFSDWLARVQSTSNPQSGGPLAATVFPWGSSGSTAVVAVLPRKMHILQGQLNVNPRLESGQAFQQAVSYPLSPQEIVRCTALAIRRRRELMGPAGEHSQLSRDLVNAFSVRVASGNTWTEAWLDLLLGLAYAATGRSAQAAQALEKSLLMSGQYIHPLTPVAQLELGRLALAQQDVPSAAAWFAEASYSAAFFQDIGVLEEAFRLGSDAHLASRPNRPYPLLEGGAAWAVKQRYRHLQATCLLCAAENHAELGQGDVAADLLAKAAAAAARTNLGLGPWGARFHYVTALVATQQRRSGPARTALAAAMTRQAKVSSWLFQLGLADRLYVDGKVTPRAALPMYEALLGEPSAWDWRSRPLEALTMLASTVDDPLRRWFEVSLDRRDEGVFRVADQVRRHRFVSTLPLGGRLEALRWTIAAPEEMVDGDVMLRRHDLLTRFPPLARATESAHEALRKLRIIPALPSDEQQAAEQALLLSELARASGAQEASLEEIALRREPCRLVFPPVRELSDIQQGLRDGEAILLFQTVDNRILAFLITRARHLRWEVDSPVQLRREISAFLQQLGHVDPHREVSADVLASRAWKGMAASLLEHLLRGSQVDLSQGVEALIVVPDGDLWYLPFDALCFEGNETAQPLVAHMSVRYAPTLGLAVPDGRLRKGTQNLCVTLGKLHPRDRPEVAQQTFASLEAKFPSARRFSPPLPKPLESLAALVDRLLVLDDLSRTNDPPYAVPLIHDNARNRSLLEDWFPLPWGAPELLVLPGFHTAAETGLRRRPPGMAGDELFLPLCAMLSTGGRVALVSRWRVGGRSTTDLVSRFLEQPADVPWAEAWRRAVLSSWNERVVLEAEPRVRRSARVGELTADHPFFWAGYMLADCGDPEPREADMEPAAPPVTPPAEETAVPPENDASWTPERRRD